MSSVNPHRDHINTYNMIKRTFIQILMHTRYCEKYLNNFIKSENVFITK
jgi:hypothetical protein